MRRNNVAGVLAVLGSLLMAPNFSYAEPIGQVVTETNMIGADHKIVVEAFDDPGVPGVTCYVSKAVTGGISGSLGLASDPSEASIACRQVGPIVGKIPTKQEEVFNEKRSFLFKEMHVARMFDAHRNTLVYLVYSTDFSQGSPKNSVTAVPIQPWTAR